MKKWKFIFGLSALFFVFDLLSTPFQKDLDFMNFIGLTFKDFSLLPLYGYAYKVAIGSKPIAVIIFAINTLLLLATFAVASLSLYSKVDIAGIVIMGFVTLIFAIYLYPQFMYAFKAEQIWSANA